MITKEQFVEELDAIIEAQQKKQTVEDALDNYIRGYFHSIPDINEERAIKYLSALIGLEMTDDSPLVDWYYNSSRKGRINEDFIVSCEKEKYALMTPEDFYDFYCGGQNDKI